MAQIQLKNYSSLPRFVVDSFAVIAAVALDDEDEDAEKSFFSSFTDPNISFIC